jgi:hypothetical protein
MEENKPNSGRDSPTSSLAAHPGGRSSSSFFNNESHDEDDSSGGEFETEKKRKTTTREKDAKKMEPAQVAKTFERQWVKIGGGIRRDGYEAPGRVGDLLHVVQRRRGRDGGVSRVSLSIAKSGEDVEVFAAEEVRREESLLL